jgi:RNA polymerase sigma factor (sigma-70 family)
MMTVSTELQTLHIAASLVVLALASLKSALATNEELTMNWPHSQEIPEGTELQMTQQTKQAFIEAVDKHERIIFKMCRIYCNRPMDREDLYQEIVARLWENYPSFRNESSIQTWIYSVAANTGMVHLRKYQRRKVEYRELVPEGVGVYSQAPSHYDESAMILDKLTPVDRTIVVLVREGYSPREISDMLGKSHRAVNMRLAKLRTMKFSR